ncbi:M28 family peptidase [Flaviaesturariibacter terrae]
MRVPLFSIALLAQVSLAAQQAPPGLSLIRTEDIKKDLYALADAHFRGRSAGTIDELKAAAWEAGRLRALGVEPAGDDSTYFQFFTMWRHEYAPSSSVTLNGRALQLWKDVSSAQLTEASVTAPVLFAGSVLGLDTTIDVRGKTVVLDAYATGLNLDVSLPTWRYPRLMQQRYAAPLLRHGAAAVVFIADRYGEQGWADAAENFKRGSFDIDGGAAAVLNPSKPVLWIHASERGALQQPDARLTIDLRIIRSAYPSVNVVGRIRGTDPSLRNEYLLYSGHTDAHGIRNAQAGDSIYYGADDNASVNVALLANARAFARYRPKRSVLFVIHGAEERGLLGSRYYAAHPTVPISSIVAVLNGDMIGRNAPDSAALLGVQPPHRNSAQLVLWALDANREGSRFKLDTLWDKPAHVEGWYFRSDHLPYVRLGIPALMYTTLLHPDYHTPLDNAQRIDYEKLRRMTEWMYRTGWKVANAPRRPATDTGFKLER